MIAHARKEVARRPTRPWATAGRPSPTDEWAKKPPVGDSEQNKRAARASVEPPVLCCPRGVRIVDPSTHKLPLDISPQVFVSDLIDCSFHLRHTFLLSDLWHRMMGACARSRILQFPPPVALSFVCACPLTPRYWRWMLRTPRLSFASL